MDKVRDALRSVPGVKAIHDLHVWTITTGMESLSAHMMVDEGLNHAELLRQLQDQICDRFGIEHVTLQLESENAPECRTRC